MEHLLSRLQQLPDFRDPNIERRESLDRIITRVASATSLNGIMGDRRETIRRCDELESEIRRAGRRHIDLADRINRDSNPARIRSLRPVLRGIIYV